LDTYFDKTKILNFYYNAPRNIDDIIYSIGKISKKVKVVVNDYPSSDTILVNIRTSSNVILVTVDNIELEFIGTGEYYLIGIELFNGNVFIKYENPEQLWEDVFNFIKYEDLSAESIRHNYLKRGLAHTLPQFPIIPNTITSKFIVPKSMMIKVREHLVAVTNVAAYTDFNDSLMLEFSEFSDEILENEIGQAEDMGMIDRIKQIIGAGIYLDLERMDIYALVSKILFIADINSSDYINEEIGKNLVLIAYLIYLHIHDDIIHINTENTYVKAFKSDEKGISIVEYYIIFMVQIYKSLFNINYTKYIRDIKTVYGTFVQRIREKLKFKMTNSSLIFPLNSCGSYLKRIKLDLGQDYDAKLYQQVDGTLTAAFAGNEISFKLRDQRTPAMRSYVKKLEKSRDRFRYYPATDSIKITKVGKEFEQYNSPPSASSISSLSLQYGDKEVKTLRVKLGNISLDLDNFALMKRRMEREKKYAPDEYDESSYYRSAIMSIKTSMTEFVYLHKIGNYVYFFKTLDMIEKIKNVKIALETIRGYFFSILLSFEDRAEIVRFLTEQADFYAKFDLLDYDLEYKKQKKLEQYERRNQIYYNLTPEEKMFLGLDKLTGSERTDVLDQLVAEKFGA